METVLTKKTALELYALLRDMKLGNLSPDAKIKIIRNCRELRAQAREFEEFSQDAIDKLKSERLSDLLRRRDAGNYLTADEQEALESEWADYAEAINECLSEEAENESVFQLAMLTEDEFKSLISTNDITAGMALCIDEHLTEH